MKVYVIDGWCFVELVNDYLLAIASVEEWKKLSVNEQIQLITVTVAEYQFANLGTTKKELAN